jgi:hypothetical protein
MNALEAVEKISKLKDRIAALESVIYYVDDDRDFSDQVHELNELLADLSAERDLLADKLRAVKL